MKLSICSYSFHKLLADGKQDIFKYITDCEELGCTQLDPWMAHLAPIQAGTLAFKKKHDAHKLDSFLTSDEIRYLSEVKRAGDKAGLPFGCIAVDGGHIYEPEEDKRNANRAAAYRWLDVCAILGAPQIRLDTGGSEKMTDEQFKVIVDGFKDLVTRAQARGVEVVIENHWGATKYPDQIIRILSAVPGLGLLWDSHNFAPEVRDEGRVKCAKYAKITHIKAFKFDAAGEEPNENVPHAIEQLNKVGYKGTWGIESCPTEIDEYEGARKTIALVKKYAKV